MVKRILQEKGSKVNGPEEEAAFTRRNSLWKSGKEQTFFLSFV